MFSNPGYIIISAVWSIVIISTGKQPWRTNAPAFTKMGNVLAFQLGKGVAFPVAQRRKLLLCLPDLQPSTLTTVTLKW